MRGAVIAVDLGGTQLRTALYGPQCQALARQAEPMRAHEGGESVLQRLIERVRSMGDTAQGGWGRINAIGVSAPGPLDPRRGVNPLGPESARLAGRPARRLAKQGARIPRIPGQ